MTKRNTRMEELSDADVLARLNTFDGNKTLTAKALGVPRTTLRRRLSNIHEDMWHRTVASAQPHNTRTTHKNLLVTFAAGDDAHTHETFMTNLRAYAVRIKAELVVLGKEAVDNIIHEPTNTEVCSNVAINPTSVKPLVGMETFSGARSAVFAHTKICLASIPRQKGEPPKIIQTTGACTLPDYNLTTKIGVRAGYHHCIGAVVLDKRGVRSIRADDDGSFYDMQYFVNHGVVTKPKEGTAEAVVLGDIHFERRDRRAVTAALKLCKRLKPRTIALHDVFDFSARAKYSMNDALKRHTQYWHPDTDQPIDETIIEVCSWLKDLSDTHPDTDIVVVDSNHDYHFDYWLDNCDYKTDHKNTELFLQCELYRFRAARRGVSSPNALHWAMISLGGVHCNPSYRRRIKLLKQDESYVVNGVELGIHGHNGANGARATPMSFTRMGKKTISAHTHSPFVHEGVFVAGTLSQLDMGYNVGLSSWAHASVVMYRNGARTIVFH